MGGMRLQPRMRMLFVIVFACMLVSNGNRLLSNLTCPVTLPLVLHTRVWFAMVAILWCSACMLRSLADVALVDWKHWVDWYV